MIKYQHYISVFVLVCTYLNFAQTLTFERYSVEQGLSQSTVHSILQDEKGFLWIGTQDGLNRYDGFEFKVYTNDRKDSTSLSDNLVRTMALDKNGNLWIGTNRGLNLLTLFKDKSSGKSPEGFYTYLSDSSDKSTISDNEIRSLYFDSDGVLWIGTTLGLNKAIINYVELNKGNYKSALKITRYIYDKNNSNSLGHNFVSSITGNSKGNLYIGTMGGGLNIFEKSSEKFFRMKSNPDDSNSLSSNYVLKLHADKSGALWIATYGGGLCRYDEKTKKFNTFKHNPANANSISDNRIYSIHEDTEGNLWIGTFGTGIDKFNPVTEEFQNFRNNEHDKKTISNNLARSVFIDATNNLWVGTNRGLNKADLKPQKFFLYKSEPWNSSTLSDNFILSFTEDINGNLWIGSNKGLDKYDHQLKKYVNYKIPHNNPMRSEGFVYALHNDENGNLWIGTFGGGLIQFDIKKEKILNQFLFDPKNPNAIIDNRVTTIFEDDNGDYLIGTVAGVCRFNKSEKTFKHYLLSSKDSSELSERWISKIIKDSDKNYWVGTTSGLFMVDTNGEVKRYIYEFENESSISNSIISSLYEDENKNIWAGTDDGLNMYVAGKDNFIQYFKKDGLSANAITNITGDEQNNLWISTIHGITKFNLSTNKFRNYDIDDGLQGMEFSLGACYKNKNGEIFFGGLYGFNKFNPMQIEDNPFLPVIGFTNFKVFDKTEKSYNELLKLDNVELSYSDDLFSFEYAALDFTNSGKNQYAYKLEGFDKDWNYTGNRNFAGYTNIDPGEYVFRVKASNNDGVWNESGASIIVIIHPPFYRTWWAYTLYALMTIALLYYFRKYEINKSKRREEERLKKEREEAELREANLRAEKAELQAKAIEDEKEIEKQNIRYRIASDLHDEIGSNLSSITMLSSILSKNLSGEIETQKKNGEVLNKLTDINTAAKISAESIRDIVWFINPMSDQVGSLISRMKETANMMLGNLKYEVVDEINSSEEKINPEIKRNIYLIFKETLNNIIKHSNADEVKIVIKNSNRIFNLNIYDNGIGFEKSVSNSGNGLKNFKSRAVQINGQIEIESSPGNGTHINLKVKL